MKASSMYHDWLYVCFVISVYLLSPLEAINCVGSGPCRCTYDDGSGIVDISSVGRQDGLPRFQDQYSYDKNIFSYNPCFSMSQGNCKDSASCKKIGNDYVTMGSQSSAIWSYTGYYPRVTYTTSDNKQTEVLMMCDRSLVDPRIDVLGELTPGKLSINVFSNCACPNVCKRIDFPEDSGLSVGSILLIVFFVLLIIYFAAGTSFNYYRTHAVGKETLPNFSFWSALPGLILDGARMSWDLVCRRQTTSEYESK